MPQQRAIAPFTSRLDVGKSYLLTKQSSSAAREVGTDTRHKAAAAALLALCAASQVHQDHP